MLILCGWTSNAAVLSSRADSNQSKPIKFTLGLSQSTFISSGKNYFKSTDAESQLSAVRVGIKGDVRTGENRWVVDAKALYSQAEEQFYYDVPEVNYQKQLTTHSKIIVGRKKHDWSRSENEWKEGVWESRFSWNPLRYKTQGLSGLFFDQKIGRNSQLHVFYSPLFIPELTQKFDIQGGRIHSANPWFPFLPKKIKIFGTDNLVNYSLKTQEVSEITQQSSLALQWRFRLSDFFTELSYADKPMNQLFVRLPYKQRINQEIDVEINPVVLRHELKTATVGMQKSRWLFWQSWTHEAPKNDEPSYQWISQMATESTQSTSLLSYKNLDGALWSFSYHRVSGGISKDYGENADASDSIFDPRFKYFDAFKLSYKTEFMGWKRDWQVQSSLVYDRAQRAGVAAGQVRLAWSQKMSFIFNAQFMGLVDEDVVRVENGFLRKYRANDLVSIGANYVF